MKLQIYKKNWFNMYYTERWETCFKVHVPFVLRLWEDFIELLWLLIYWEIKIHNKPPSIINVVPLTPIKINSPLLYDIAVHVITPAKMKNPPKLQDFSNEYLRELQKISEDVNDRTYRQMKVNFTGQLFDILANKTPEDITNLQFIPSDIFESSKVRITHYIM